MTLLTDNLTALDRELSNRHIDLDPNGYFIIYVDREAGLICAKHYTNIINDRGLAVDPKLAKLSQQKAKLLGLARLYLPGELPRKYV